MDYEIWTTPPTKKRHETVIRINDIDNSKATLAEFKKELEGKDVGRGFKNKRHTKTGAIVVESFDTEQQAKLRTNLVENSNLTMKETLTPDPMFMLTGIEDCGFTNETFLEKLERLNNEVVEELGYTVKDKIQVISKRKCYRTPAKSNWKLQELTEGDLDRRLQFWGEM